MKKILTVSIASIVSIVSMTNKAMAQVVTFDEDDYESIGVYDSWEMSPFHNGPVKLEGNVKVISNFLNQEDESGRVLNDTKNILGFQRSRYGSNTYGAKVTLKEPFDLDPTVKYVHVYINKPVEGRTMLICLGKRTDRPGQSPDTEQTWSLCTSTVKPGVWSDAVFAINSASGVEIHSFVIVPDCESTNNLKEDFLTYIDQIEVNSSSTPRIVSGTYIVNAGKDATLSRTDRYLKSVSFSTGKAQKVTVPTQTDKLLYHDKTSYTFVAKAGDTVLPTFSYQGSWMSGYVYIDRDNDGRFDTDGVVDGVIPEGSDVMAFSYYKGYNSKPTSVSSGNVLNPPSFTIPADMEIGFYRMRYKVDWDEIDAGGNISASNDIVANGGGIVDVMLNIHGDYCNVNDANRNGEVLAADSSKLNGYQAPFGEKFTIKMHPERGFTYEGIKVRHGYNLAGDAVVKDNVQWREVTYPASKFVNDEFTIPADVMDGDVEIEGLFVQAPDAIDTPTDQVSANTAIHHTYDLSGRRVTTPSFATPSVVIQNGKKVLGK